MPVDANYFVFLTRVTEHTTGRQSDINQSLHSRREAQILPEQLVPPCSPERGRELRERALNTGLYGLNVRGVGDVILPLGGYFEEIQRVLKKHDVLLVADEVICGFGRTGNMWGS